MSFKGPVSFQINLPFFLKLKRLPLLRAHCGRGGGARAAGDQGFSRQRLLLQTQGVSCLQGGSLLGLTIWLVSCLSEQIYDGNGFFFSFWNLLTEGR